MVLSEHLSYPWLVRLASSLEEGRLHGGSETESEAALDKDYWIRRCGEVCSPLSKKKKCYLIICHLVMPRYKPYMYHFI